MAATGGLQTRSISASWLSGTPSLKNKVKELAYADRNLPAVPAALALLQLHLLLLEMVKG